MRRTITKYYCTVSQKNGKRTTPILQAVLSAQEYVRTNAAMPSTSFLLTKVGFISYETALLVSYMAAVIDL
jgi:hypothetical protein